MSHSTIEECGEMHGPRRDDRLDRMDHTLGKLREARLQEAGRKKRAKRARNRREKRRRKKTVLGDGTLANDQPAVPERSIPVLQCQKVNDWVREGESGPTAVNRHVESPVEAWAQRLQISPLDPSLIEIPTDSWIPPDESKLRRRAAILRKGLGV
jgi:hypothetical protein